MRLQHRQSEDSTATERNWRYGLAGEIIDQDGGMVAGDVLTRFLVLCRKLAGNDRFEKTRQAETDSGAECVRRWEEARKRQEEHARIFQ